MPTALTIESAEAQLLAERLASESGEDVTQAVIVALRMRLATVRRERPWEPDELRAKETEFYEVVDGSRARWPGGLTSADMDDLLYDEYGLPR